LAVVFGSTQAPLQSSGVEPLQPRPHTPLVHVAFPLPESGPSQTFAHVPQCDGSVGSTHVPLQLSDVGEVQPVEPSSPAAPSFGGGAESAPALPSRADDSVPASAAEATSATASVLASTCGVQLSVSVHASEGALLQAVSVAGTPIATR
jgi:hypothetical protein